MTQTYSTDFFLHHNGDPARSARATLEMILHYAPCSSVIDIGCGTGSWLKAFHDHGIHDITGIDGNYVDRALLEIPSNHFTAMDLSHPASLDRRFDLVVCLEVAEHLPASQAAGFVKWLTSLGDVVLFSAAIPNQGGTSHVNEQWPDYWQELFESHDYVAVDCLRHRLWDDPGPCWWYAQNMLFYIHRDALDRFPALAAEITDRPLRRLVHPQLFRIKNLELRRLQGHPFREAAKRASPAGLLSVLRRMRKKDSAAVQMKNTPDVRLGFDHHLHP